MDYLTIAVAAGFAVGCLSAVACAAFGIRLLWHRRTDSPRAVLILCGFVAPGIPLCLVLLWGLFFSEAPNAVRMPAMALGVTAMASHMILFWLKSDVFERVHQKRIRKDRELQQ